MSSVKALSPKRIRRIFFSSLTYLNSQKLLISNLLNNFLKTCLLIGWRNFFISLRIFEWKSENIGNNYEQPDMAKDSQSHFVSTLHYQCFQTTEPTNLLQRMVCKYEYVSTCRILRHSVVSHCKSFLVQFVQF